MTDLSRSAVRWLLIPLLAATLLLGACDSGDIHSVAYKAGCPVPGPFTVSFGSGPTVNPDGSLTFSVSGTVRFNRSYTTTTIVSICTEMSPLLTGATAFVPLLDGVNSTMYVAVTYPATGQVDLTLGDDNSGVGCGTRSFFDPAFTVGGSVRLAARLDQTGAFPVLSSWILNDPATSPPDLASDDPAYCLTDSSTNWNFSTTTDATLGATSMSVRKYGFGP